MTSPAVPDTALTHLYAGLRRSQVHRDDRGWIGGVCAGVSERLDLSVTVVRVLAVLLALVGPGVALYLVAWLVLPDEDGRLHLEGVLRRAARPPSPSTPPPGR